MYLLLTGVLLTLTGCTMLNLQRNIREIDHSIILAGRVQAPAQPQGTVIALVYEQTPQGAELLDFQPLDSNGYYLFVVADGHEYFLAAFLDTNRNLHYDPGEPAGYYGEPTPLSQTVEYSKEGINLQLSASTKLPELLHMDLKSDAILGNNNIPLIFGDVISLDDPRLSREQAKQGLWAPLDFAKQNGVGVFFLQKYDPGKIPVLFVHGFGGTPLDFELFIDSLDRSCYQPWLFYYPTGVRLAKSEKLMTVLTQYFQKKYQFTDMVMVAHSMGGLISRSSIVKSITETGSTPVKLMVTFSTPWSGHSAAARGVSNSPIVMPAWIDIQPNSGFVGSLFDVKLDSYLDYYLFFSFNDNQSLFSQENDGTVSVASQLNPRAQEEAKRLYGVNASHRDILRDPTIVEKFTHILAQPSADLNNRSLQYQCALSKQH